MSVCKWRGDETIKHITNTGLFLVDHRYNSLISNNVDEQATACWFGHTEFQLCRECSTRASSSPHSEHTNTFHVFIYCLILYICASEHCFILQSIIYSLRGMNYILCVCCRIASSGCFGSMRHIEQWQNDNVEPSWSAAVDSAMLRCMAMVLGTVMH